MEIRRENNLKLKPKEEEYMKLFQHLFDNYFKVLTIYSYKFVNDWHTAEDITQDVFMSLWINKKEIEFSKPIIAYLYRAIYNRSINYINSSLTQNRREANRTVDEMINDEIMSYNQYDELLLKEMAANIDSFIETLPNQCKKVYKMSRIENLKNKEIAHILNISEKTVEKHISKALEELRSHLMRIKAFGLFFYL